MAKVNRVLPRECTGHSKRLLPATWDTTLTWTLPDGKCQNHIDYILWSWRWRSYIQSAKTRPGADCGSDYEFLIAKFRLKLKKVGNSKRPFRYDLNQIPYDYSVEVTNRSKGLDLTECLKNYGWRLISLFQRQLPRPSSRKRNEKRQNDWEGLTHSWGMKRRKRQRRKGKIHPSKCKVPKNSKER